MRKYAVLLVVVFLVASLVAFASCGPQPVMEVTMDSPGNGSTVSSLTPILAWSCSENGATYRLKVANDSGFQNLIVDESNLSGLSYAIPSGKLSGGKSYYWKVHASKGNQTSGWTSYWSFQTQGGSPGDTGTVLVNATLDGSQWSGLVDYTLSGPKSDTGSAVPQSFSNLSAGTYTIGYSTGGPSGAMLAGITPSASQALSAGGSVSFTLNFQSQAADTIMVNATLDGYSWSGRVNYTIHGPQGKSGSTVPESFGSVPDGSYTISYFSGGPSGATLSSITPQPTQTLSTGGTISFTFNFHSQAASTIFVNATLDGSQWSGSVRYAIHGPETDSGYSAPDSFSGMPGGTYTISYRSGGPSGATLSSITPQPTRTLSDGGSITFTFNFHSSQATGIVKVRATLDGESWSGRANYAIHGPFTDSYSAVPHSFGNLPPGTYTLSYSSGGPAGATLSNITPSPSQTLYSNDSITFTLNFHTAQGAGTISVKATLDGSPWSGQARYTLHGPDTDAGYSIPDTFKDMSAGTYTLSYNSGGPAGATLSSISPSPSQTLSLGGMMTFTLNFHTTQSTGTIMVNATLDGSSWSGQARYTLHGPETDSGHAIPDTFTGLAAGTYTLSYSSGGPAGATLSSISPSPRQRLSSGGTVIYTLNFHSTQSTGTIMVKATLDGSSWSGEVEYSIYGPYQDQSQSVPDSFSGCPAGRYTITYRSGGPHQSKLISISPSPTQNLSSGGSILFILNFKFQGGILPEGPGPVIPPPEPPNE